MFKKVDPKQNFPKLEEKILKFWRKNKTFEKSVKNRPKSKTFSFYDGPPYATGMPHYGHLLAGTIKDVVPRYKTMQGYRVERVWGWDTHGLPIENIVEQDLNFKTKLHIREYGIDKFNEKCRESVLTYTKEWRKIVERTGRWVDIENAYITMDIKYMESVWWVFKSLWDKDLIYKSHKVLPYCPRCATGLSNFEVGLEYQDKTDKAITVKFELEDEPGTYFLAWTTTPWTLPGNLALAVGKDIKYVKIKSGKNKYILAKDRLEIYKEDLTGKTEEEILGKDLVGKKYKPIFPYYKNPKKAFEVISGNFVSTEDGTGIVHIAPAFGEDDYNVAKENNIDFFMPVDDLGHFTLEVFDYSGKGVIEFETNEQITKDLKDKVLKTEYYSHAYPHCWRCKTPLIYKAIDSWFVRIDKLKKQAIENNKKIHWVPDFVGKGRFQKMLESAPDWNISRNRFWGVPLPVWVCKKCNKTQVFGSVKELEESAGKKISDIHLHKLLDVKIKCQCGSLMELTGEVLDVWFDSGSMPYASIHYPFENKEKFQRDFPADFIAEGIDQTRGWFYSLLILGTALFGKSPYKNVVVNGIVLTEDGQKMSKSLNNYPDPMEVVEKYGADSLRFYMMGSPAVKAEDLCFSEKGVDEVFKKIVLTLWNSYSFFVTYASLDNFKPKNKLNTDNVLDKWIISKLNNLIKSITDKMERYELSLVIREPSDFIEELSNWYIRRSRKRFWKSENDTDKLAAYETLYWVLINYCKLLAPFSPFITDEIWQNLVREIDPKREKSIHLSDWPKADEKMLHNELEEKMTMIKSAVELGLSERAKNGIKVRQPLSKLTIETPLEPRQNLLDVVADEINVKKVLLKKGKKLAVSLDTKITPELKKEGLARELVRQIQEARKKAGFNVEDRIKIYFETKSKALKETISEFQEKQDYSIKRETLAREINEEKSRDIDYESKLKVNGEEIWLGLKKIKK